MELEKQGPNLTVLKFRDGTQVLFSYSTPVAVWRVNGEYSKTARFYSRTTSRHVNAFIGKNSARTVDQSEIDALVREGR